jgi:hypothetical protein
MSRSVGPVRTISRIRFVTGDHEGVPGHILLAGEVTWRSIPPRTATVTNVASPTVCGFQCGMALPVPAHLFRSKRLGSEHWRTMSLPWGELLFVVARVA